MEKPRSAESHELDNQLESLFNTVWQCERQWRIDDRFDLIFGVKPVQFGHAE